MKARLILVILAIFLTSAWSQPTSFIKEPLYLSPRPNSQFVSAGTTIAFRLGGIIDENTLTDSAVSIVGSKSGSYSGKITLADDKTTVIFKPDQPFTPGETVSVTIDKGITTREGFTFPGKAYSFTVSSKTYPDTTFRKNAFEEYMQSQPELETDPTARFENRTEYRTLPYSFPELAVTVPANGTGEGYFFLAPFPWAAPTQDGHLVIIDNDGEPIFLSNYPFNIVDFKKQSNGLLSFFDTDSDTFKLLDSSYQIVDTIAAGNGYVTDLHDLQVLPNGHALLMIYDPQTVDMSTIVSGGNPAAQVIGLIIQEIDQDDNVVFEWKSWDHFQITDTVESLTSPVIDYAHGNAVELDHDGNLLISSRTMHEITKIDGQTGDIIWRLGGKNNQFTFLNDPGMFFFQHDIRRLENGNITLFDNRSEQVPVYSRAVEYKIDEENKTVELEWQFRLVPETYSRFMGNVQRLENSNSVIGWGSGYPTVTEVKPDGTIAFQLTLGHPYVSYRAFRFPWEGTPVWKPVLIVEEVGTEKNLFYSWNGATDVSSYKVYAGRTEESLKPIAQKEKTGFETTSVFADPLNQFCYFQVVPIDGEGNAGEPSEVIPTEICNRNYYLPQVTTP